MTVVSLGRTVTSKLQPGWGLSSHRVLAASAPLSLGLSASNRLCSRQSLIQQSCQRSFSSTPFCKDQEQDENSRKRRISRLRRRVTGTSGNPNIRKDLKDRIIKAQQQQAKDSEKNAKKSDEEEDLDNQPKWYSEKPFGEESSGKKPSSNFNKDEPFKPNGSPQQNNSQGQQQPYAQITINPQYILLGLLISGLAFLYMSPSSESTYEISWQQFKTDYLDKGRVTKLHVVNRSTVYVESKDSVTVHFSIGSVDLFEKRMEEAQRGVPANERVPISYSEQGSAMGMIFGFLPTLLLLGALWWMSRRPPGGAGGGVFGMGQSRAKLYNKSTDVNVKFADVAGCSEAKEEIMEFVNFLKEPAKYEELGAKIPRGAILSGPPGTGKTLLAKATAGEAGVPFFSVSGSEFIEMFAGVGASRVRDLFKAARAKAPSIVFIDEIDAIGKARNKGMGSGGHDEREATLNQLLVEMDGFESSDHVVVLAGTNRADVLDPALLRPGRFDRHVNIDRPDIEGRIEIYNVHLKNIKYNTDISELPGKLAAMTPGFSGADIANVVNEAALIAARNESNLVEFIHFEQAIERVIAGLEKKTRVLVPEKKKVVAYHEAGHAVCGWFLKYADPLVKVSIIPRGSAALGYAQYLPPDQYLISEEQFKDKMAMTLGGRVSEEINFSSVTLGGSDDFKKVTQMAKAMVTQLGMSQKVGQVYYEQTQESITKPYSEHTGEVIDNEIRRIVSEAHTRCKQLLEEKKQEVGLVAEELLRKEVIGREDMIRLLGPRPFPERNDAFDKYLSGAVYKNEKGDSSAAEPASA